MAKYVAPAALILAALLPLFVQTWLLTLFSRALIFASLALGLQIIAGQAGQLSLGHAAFFGLGAYTAGLLTRDLGLPFPLALIAAAAVAGIGGLVMSVSVRVRGVYFAIATFAFGIVVNLLFVNLVDVTGGARGLAGIPAASLGPLSLESHARYYLFVLAVVAAEYLGVVRLTRGRFGRALRCIGQNELAARSVGIDITRCKIQAIVLGSAWAGVAGGLMAQFLRFASPEMFTLLQSIDVVTMLAIGGIASPAGAVLGALVMSTLSSYLRAFGTFATVLDGLLIVLAMMYMPGGLVGLVQRLRQRWTEVSVAKDPSRRTLE